MAGLGAGGVSPLQTIRSVKGQKRNSSWSSRLGLGRVINGKCESVVTEVMVRKVTYSEAKNLDSKRPLKGHTTQKMWAYVQTPILKSLELWRKM